MRVFTTNVRHLVFPALLAAAFSSMPSPVVSQEARFDSLEEVLQNTAIPEDRFSIYRELIWSYSRNNVERAKKLNADLLQMARESENDLWINQARYYYGVIYKNTGNNPLALSYLDSTLQFYQVQRDDRRMAHALYQIGIVYKNMGQIQEGLDAFNKTLEIYRRLGDTSSIAMSVNAKGSMFRQLNQHERAIEAYHSSLDLHRAAGDTLGMADALYNLGNAHKAIGKFDSAMLLYNQSESLMSEKNDEWRLGFILENRGDLYNTLGDYGRASTELSRSVDIRQKYGQKGTLAPTLLLLAKVQQNQGRLDDARQSIERALDIAKSSKMSDHIQRAYESLSKIYEAQGKSTLALEAFKLHNTIKDSIFNEKISQQFAELETIHQTREKQEQINNLGLEQELNQIKLSRQRDVITGISIGAILLLVLLWRYSVLNKKVKHQNSIITRALNEKEILLKEIHHRVKNNLQLISSLLSLQSSTIDDSSALAALTEGQSRVQSMALIHQDLYRSDNLTSIQIEGYIKKLCQNLFDTYNIRGERIALQLDIAQLSLDVSTLIPMGLILNELISNSLKYAFPSNQTGTIGVRLKPISDRLLLEVWDDGIGFGHNARTDGFGHKLVHTFAKKLEADVSIAQKDGTIVSMNIANFKVA